MTDQTMNVKTNQFAVRPADRGGMEILLDGVDIAEMITGFSIAAEAGVPYAAVEIRVSPKHTMRPEFEGLAEVSVEVDDPGPAAAAFLAAIDAEELDKAVLARTDLTNEPHGLTEAMLRQLTEWASGT